MKNDEELYPSSSLPPWKIKVTERIPILSRKAREEAIERAGFNTFLLRAPEVTIDLLTDSGTNAMFDTQKAAMETADESYTGSESFRRFVETIRELYGLHFVRATNQGRAAEAIIADVLVRPGQRVLSNMYFTTSRANVEHVGGIWEDVSIKEAHNPESIYPYKGNIDLDLLKIKLKELGKEGVAFVRIEACLNMAGGQPFSLENLYEVRSLCDKYGVPLVIDATRAIENSYLIKRNEWWGERHSSIQWILRKMCSIADWIIVSAKKDAVVNIGGFLAERTGLYEEKIDSILLRRVGGIEYGGLAGRDLDAIATGLREAVDYNYIAHRVEQTRRFGKLLFEMGIPIVLPVGGHAVYLNAKRFLPHIAQEHFPAQALAAEVYIECGARGMERGIVSAGRNPKTGKDNPSKLELVRLTIPRMVYTDEHLKHVAWGVKGVCDRVKEIRGLRMVYEPETLRFFKARFERI